MDILRAFKILDEEHTINIQGTIDEPLFQANQIAKLLNIKYIRDSIRHFDDDEKVVVLNHTLGGFQKTTFLTEIGLYRLLGVSKNPIAKTFQKWVCNVVRELRIKGKYELETRIEEEVELRKLKVEEEHHKTLMASYHKKDVLYFTKIKKIEDKTIVKLGWTDDVTERGRTLAVQFGDCKFLDIFECNNNSKFELFLKRHPLIVSLRYDDKIIEDVKSTETILVTEKEYKEVIKVVKRNIKFYQGFSPEQYCEMKRLELELEKVKLEREKIQLEMLSIRYKAKEVKEIEEIENVKLENQEIEESDDEFEYESYLGVGDNVPRKNTRNRKIQQYDPDTFDLIKTYDGIMDVVRTNPSMSEFGIRSSANANTKYQGYRWYFIARDAEDIKYEIPPTVEINSSIPQFVAMLNKDKTQIINVFASQKLAADDIGMKRKQTINDSIHTGIIVKNQYYFAFFNHCSEDLRNEYLSRKELPKVVLSKGTKVLQIDIKTRKTIKVFDSIAAVKKEFCVSRESIKNACATGETHKGFFWQYAEVETHS